MAGSFDGLNPPKKMTDPKGTPAGAYPRHVHRWVGANVDGTPKLNAFRVVTSPSEESLALKEGWSLTPVLSAPELLKAKTA